MMNPTSQCLNDVSKFLEKFLKYSLPSFINVLWYITMNIIRSINSNNTVYNKYFSNDSDDVFILNRENIIELKHNSNSIIPILLKIFFILFFMLPPLIL